MMPQCKSNSDHSCFCPSPDFTSAVIDCVQAWGVSDDDIQAALSYFTGICAAHVSQNPGIITAIPSTITLIPTPAGNSIPWASTVAAAGPTSYITITQSGTVITSTVYAPPVIKSIYSPGPVTTISYTQTITTASSTIVVTTAVTVPQVSFVTATPPPAPLTNGPPGAVVPPGAPSTSVGLVPAAPAAPSITGIAGATGSAPFFQGFTSATGTLPPGVQTQTAGPSIATFTGAAARSVERDLNMAIGGMLGLIALLA
jgi:hypothetical protein